MRTIIKTIDRVLSVGGFCLSTLLLAVCLFYVRSPQWHGTFHAFFARDVYAVFTPPGFRIAFLAFAVLNAPAVMLVEGLVVVVDPRGAGNRIRFIFGSLFVASAVWWYLVGRIIGFVRRRAKG